MSLGITVWHHEVGLVMPISDPRNRFFYPHHTPMKDTYKVTFISLRLFFEILRFMSILPDL